MLILTFAHLANIIIHVSAGFLALLFGLAALVAKKGGQRHKRAGSLFLIILSIVIVTGLVGVFVFRRNSFLLVITLLSGYQGFSGYRVIRTKSNQPAFIDIMAAVFALASVLYFLYYFRSIGMIWSPVIIFSTVGYLLLMIAYDLLRYLIPPSKYNNIWLYEHMVKMIGAFSAITSAFTGTVFPGYQPYSQFLPSVAGLLLMVGFIVYYTKRNSILNKDKFEIFPSKE